MNGMLRHRGWSCAPILVISLVALVALAAATAAQEASDDADWMNRGVWTARLKDGAVVADSILRLGPKGNFFQPMMHPDGSKVVFWGREGEERIFNIWVSDVDGTNCRMLTTNGKCEGPTWSPDGKSIYYSSGTEWDRAHIWRMDADGQNQRQVTFGPGRDARPCVSPDGKTLVFVSNRPTDPGQAEPGDDNLWRMPVGGSEAVPLTRDKGNDFKPCFSRDGRFLAYHANEGEDGPHNLAILEWPDGPRRFPMRLNEGEWLHGPFWFADGRHLLAHGYLMGSKLTRLYVVDVESGTAKLFPVPGFERWGHGSFDRTETRMSFDGRRLPAASAQVQDATVPASITVGVMQQAREPELVANREKIIRYLGEAKARGCRLVIFPEDALGSPVGTAGEDVDRAVAAIGDAARANDVYVVFSLAFPIEGYAPDKRGQRMVVIGPDGQILQEYNKLICNLPPNDPTKAPGLFYVDGIPCSGMVCADRWLRGVEELPVTLGARILIDCSANARREWIPEFSWYLPVSRAVRNNVYSIFCNMGEHPQGLDEARHGHSAIMNPDGSFAARTDDTGDVMLVATLDLAKADAAEAKRRHNHPVFKPFWDMGRNILSGEKAEAPLPQPLSSAPVPITIAAAQMACSRDVEVNLDTMARLIGKAAANGADVVTFPELAVTGALTEDIEKVSPKTLEDALERLQSATRQAGTVVVFGMPRLEGEQRWNSACVLGPDGKLLTCYDQMVVDRSDLFNTGRDARAMWFDVKGVPAIVTVGTDARWNEIGELAAVRGAQLLFNIAYDQDISEEATLLRTQLWVQLASFHTFGAAVNAADPRGLAMPSAFAKGGSSLWEDFNGHKKAPSEPVEVFSQYSGCRIVSAGEAEEILYATRTLPRHNAYFQQYVVKRYPHLLPWYHIGAEVVSSAH